MTIKDAKASNYNDVNTNFIIDYCKEYNENITRLLQDINPDNISRTQLKRIAASLETVQKVLNYEINGIY